MADQEVIIRYGDTYKDVPCKGLFHRKTKLYSGDVFRADDEKLYLIKRRIDNGLIFTRIILLVEELGSSFLRDYLDGERDEESSRY